MTSPLPANPVARWLLLLVLAAGVYFFRGFLVPVLAALIIGFASWPIYKRLVRACGGRTAVAATIALAIVLLVLVIPLALAFSYAVERDWHVGRLAGGGKSQRRSRTGICRGDAISRAMAC